MQGVLLANDDAQPPAGFGALQITGAIDSQKFARMRRDEFIPAGDVAQRTGINIAIGKANRGMKNRDARSAQPLEIVRSKPDGCASQDDSLV